MKRLLVVLLLNCFSYSAYSVDFFYECHSNKNQQIFTVGSSQEIYIELNSDLMLINNLSRIWNVLGLDDENDSKLIFKSFSTGNTYSTLDLTVTVPMAMTKGQVYSPVQISKEVDSKSITQDYSCVRI